MQLKIINKVVIMTVQWLLKEMILVTMRKLSLENENKAVQVIRMMNLSKSFKIVIIPRGVCIIRYLSEL